MSLKCSHKTLRIPLDPVMGLRGFVIHDIYQINCHLDRKKIEAWDKPTHHFHVQREGCWELQSELIKLSIISANQLGLVSILSCSVAQWEGFCLPSRRFLVWFLLIQNPNLDYIRRADWYNTVSYYYRIGCEYNWWWF